jgi:hypothetical protein
VEALDDEVDDGRLVPRARCGRIAADGGADDGEDARANDGSDAEGGERYGAEGLFEGVLGALGVGDELVDAFGGEELGLGDWAWQGAGLRQGFTGL